MPGAGRTGRRRQRQASRPRLRTIRRGADRCRRRPAAAPDDRSAAAPGGHGGRAGGRRGSGMRGFRRRFAGACALGVLALGCAVGLMGTSGWLISRAAQQPPVLYLMVAVTATRTFGIGRAVFRYGERLVAHDAVFRALGGVRVAVFRRLERLAPGRARPYPPRRSALPAGRGRRRRPGLLPALAAARRDRGRDRGCGAAAFTGWLLPAAGAVLGAGLLAAGVAVPALSVAVARRTEGRLAPARGELSARVLGLFTGTAELTVAGALPARRARGRPRRPRAAADRRPLRRGHRARRRAHRPGHRPHGDGLRLGRGPGRGRAPAARRAARRAGPDSRWPPSRRWPGCPPPRSSAGAAGRPPSGCGRCWTRPCP